MMGIFYLPDRPTLVQPASLAPGDVIFYDSFWWGVMGVVETRRLPTRKEPGVLVEAHQMGAPSYIIAMEFPDRLRLKAALCRPARSKGTRRSQGGRGVQGETKQGGEDL